MYESIKALETRTSAASNFVLPSNTILSCFFFFVIIDFYFLISAAIAQIFNSISELVIPTVIANNDINEEMETQPRIIEAKISKCSR